MQAYIVERMEKKYWAKLFSLVIWHILVYKYRLLQLYILSIDLIYYSVLMLYYDNFSKTLM